MAAKKNFSPEAIADARRRYEETDEPVAAIAADLEIEVPTFYVYIKRWGLTLRRDRAPVALFVPPQDEPALDLPDISVKAADETLAARLEGAIEIQLRGVERLQATPGTRGRSIAEAERVARTLATLVRTLKEAHALRAAAGQTAGPDDEFPGDIDAFRRELARRINAFVESRTDGGFCDGGGGEAAPDAG